jgi:threonylcarbamoyladenosine tRNA methylthiotransferase CDKAL1
VYVKTYGCSHNASDSEYMCGLLAEYGYTLLPAARAAEADLWLINSCTVKNPSQDHLSTDLKRGRELRKRLVVAGCVPQADSSLAKPGGLLDGVSLLGVQQFDRVVEVIQLALAGSTVALLDRPHGSRPSLDLPKVRRPPWAPHHAAAPLLSTPHVPLSTLAHPKVRRPFYLRLFGSFLRQE